MHTLTYKRGQIAWALWRSLRPLGSKDDGPPPVFGTRLKRLLDLDREPDASKATSKPAFTTSFDGGSGIEAAYTPADVFALALALALLDIGFKQGEIVFVMRHLRKVLNDWYPRLVRRPSLIDRQRVLASQYPKLPRYEPGPDKAALADARVFLILNRIEITEVLAAGPKTKPGEAVFLEPEICEGLTALQTRLHDLMPLRRRTVILLELTATAQSITHYLAEAPVVPRGRPRHEA